MVEKINKLFTPEYGKLFLKEVVPHLVICSVLTYLEPSQWIYIFLIGLILPDFFTIVVKIPSVNRKYIRYYDAKPYLDAIHGVTLIFAVLAFLWGYPLIGLAGMSHAILDYFGF